MTEEPSRQEESYLEASFWRRLRTFYFLPPREKSNRFLPLIIGVMAFLALLGSATGLAIFNGTKAWSSALAKTITVQIVDPNTTARERQTTSAMEILEQTPGVQSIRRMTKEELDALLEPWLGTGNVTEDLPVPEMISVTLKPGAKIDAKALTERLSSRAPGASVDDHQQWIGQMSALSTMVQVAVFFSILLIGMTTLTIVVFATRAAMASHRETIEIVHLIGAKDSLIAGEFRKLFMIHGFKGGLIGLVAAFATIALFVYLSARIGGGLLPKMTLSSGQILILALFPAFTAFLAMWVAEITARHALGKLV